MNERALYYPYIHIRDVNWLKATLLLFSQVRRMVPTTFTPSDAPGVSEFAEYVPGQDTLLQPAAVWWPRVQQAQTALAEKLKHDAEDPAFLRQFGVQSAWESPRDDPFGFQVHQQKLAPALQDVLRDYILAWAPIKLEAYDRSAEYVEMHPSVGQVVMAVTAIACAQGEALDIVGDARSWRLHSALIEKNSEAVYNAWLHPAAWPEPLVQPTGEDLFEFLLRFNCDLSKLTRESLALMKENRDPLKNLIVRLREMAAYIHAVDCRQEQEQSFKDGAARVLREWRADRANMSHFWRVFFGAGVAEPGIKFLGKATEKLLEGGGAGAVAGGTGAAAAGAGAAGALLGSLVGAGSGLALGILVHTGKSYSQMRTEEQKSAYRYLTLLERAGVVFRSDLGGSAPGKGML